MSEPAAAEAPESAARPAPVPLRANGGFRMLWAGQLLSDTGSEIGLVAYPLLILALTHSPVLAGVVGTARAAALICIQLPAGALSDRLDRRRSMIACDTVRAVLLALLGILIAIGLASWPAVLVVSLVEGAAGGLFDPSAVAALPAIVPEDQLVEAWAFTEGRTWAAGLAGPALGGLLFGLGRAVPFLADAFSYAVSFTTVSRIRGRFRPQQPPARKALRHEVLDGLKIVWQVPLLRATAVQAPLINFAFNGVLFAITVGLRQHGVSATVIGLAQGFIMAGGVLGAPAAPRLQDRLRPRTMSLIMTVAGTLLFAAAALLMPSPLAALPVAAVVLLAPAANAGLFAATLRQTPEEMRGRVTSITSVLAMGLAALAPLLAGLLVEHASASWAVGAFAAANAVAAVITLSMPGFRDADPPPASQPEQARPLPNRKA